MWVCSWSMAGPCAARCSSVVERVAVGELYIASPYSYRVELGRFSSGPAMFRNRGSSDASSSRMKLNTAVARPGKVSSTIATVIVESPVEDDADHVPELPPPRLPAARGSQDSARRVGLFKRGASTHVRPISLYSYREYGSSCACRSLR